MSKEKDLLAAQELARQSGMPLPLAAMELHERNISQPIFWPEPNTPSDNDAVYAEVDLLPHGGWLSDFAVTIADQVQFPRNTAFAHLLGILSAATAKSFRYLYFGNSEKAVNLYIVTAQPPSSGKSGVHEAFTTPCQIHLEELNKQNTKRRIELEEKLEGLQEQEKKGDPVSEDIFDLTQEINQLNRIEFAFDDITPEAAEAAAVRQGGLINICSAEADALNIILGSVYQGQSAKANYGMFLKTWDTEWHSPSRVTRQTKAGFVYGSVAVIAQQTAIDALLEAGMSGRGISERMMLLFERPIIGHRDFTKFEKANGKLIGDYNDLIRNVIMESDKQVLKLNDESLQLVQQYRQTIEPKLADDGDFSNSMLRGAMGKADKQIIKIACLLHISEEWATKSPKRRLFVKPKHIEAAIKIFDQLAKTYVQAADRMGYAGDSSELNCVIESLERRLEKRQYRITFRQLRDNVKNKLVMKNVANLSTAIREKIVPALERMGCVVVDSDDIYINPRLK